MLSLIAAAMALDATGTSRAPVDVGGLQRVTGMAAGPQGQLDVGLTGGWAGTLAEAHYTDGTTEPLMAGLISAQLGVGYTFLAGLRAEAGLPVLLGAAAPEAMPAGVGDAWVDVQWAAIRSEAFSLGPALELTIPSGRADQLQGAGGVGFALSAAAGGRAGIVRWAAELGGGSQGYAPSPLIDAQRGGELRFGGGARVTVFGPVSVGAEVDSTIAIVPINYDPSANASLSGAEALLSAGVDLGRFDIAAYSGVGLVDGVGVPDVRVGLSVRARLLGGKPAIKDDDSDGVADGVDQCPTEREDDDGFQDEDGCPELDDDVDGLPDATDKCPNDPEDRDFFKDSDGCPDLDDDADGLPDIHDRCPRDAGPAESDGCPDRDRDGMLDAGDRCPDDAAIPGTDLLHNDGCPGRVVVFPDRVRLGQEIQFDPGKSVIRPESLALVAEIAEVLKRYPDLPRIELGAHVDAGADPTLKLTNARAEAVRVALVKAGVAAERLVAVGYGELRPLAPNDVEQNRVKNRRVELVFVR